MERDAENGWFVSEDLDSEQSSNTFVATSAGPQCGYCTPESELRAQRERVDALKQKLAALDDEAARELLSVADHLVRRSIWIVGGDGWAYDIGYGGLDQVLASGRDVNLLVLDTEVYSNTGGQASAMRDIVERVHHGVHQDVHRQGGSVRHSASVIELKLPPHSLTGGHWRAVWTSASTHTVLSSVAISYTKR